MARMRPPRIRALQRERLIDLQARLDDERLVLVVAPAGSGKTTFLAQLAASSAPAVWYWVDASDAHPPLLLAHLERAAAIVLPGLPAGWGNVDEAARALESWHGPPPTLILDDFHVLRGSHSEALIEKLIQYCPPGVRFVVGSRSVPGFNLSKLRVSGLVREIGADALRFRSWEVERLFRDVYGEPMVPEDALLLTRRTRGWAAGLQLFHLATRGKPAPHRRSILTSLGARPTLVQEYLARNVIEELPARLRSFLIRTCVLEQLSESLCYRLLGREGNRPLLVELERRQLLTLVEPEGEYRCHEILRSHLEHVLEEEIGEAGVRDRYRDAAALLEDTGALGQALRAYCRAEDWAAVRRLLGSGGERLVDETGSWIDEIPDHILSQDPWLSLAMARRSRAVGRFKDAIRAYEDAERDFGPAPASGVCRRERLTLAAWLEPGAAPPAHWSAPVKLATMREPIGARRTALEQIAGAERSLAAGLTSLLAGEIREALIHLRVAADAEASPALTLAAELSSAAARLLAGDPVGSDLAERAADGAERLDVPWLARLGRALLALGDRADGPAEAAGARAAFERCGDRWGSSLAALLEGWGALRRGLPAAEPMSRAAWGFAELGAGVLETWARAALAVAMGRDGDDGAHAVALRALSAARREKLRGVAAVAHLALAEGRPEADEEARSRPIRLAEECGLALPLPPPAGRVPSPSHPSREDDRPGTASRDARSQPSVVVRCFGSFEMSVRGVPVEMAHLKPRSRQALRLLVLRAGRPVHREVLAAALWPDADPEAAIRNLHVTLSLVRHALDEAGLAAQSIVREDGTYRLAFPGDAWIDLLEFERAASEGHAARADDDLDRAIEAYGRALDLFRDGLLPEDGPAEWVVTERDRYAAAAFEAVRALAEMHLRRNQPAAAAAACERGLRLDRYRDELWRLRIEACERAGDLASAARARRQYRSILAELDVVDVDLSGGASRDGRASLEAADGWSLGSGSTVAAR